MLCPSPVVFWVALFVGSTPVMSWNWRHIPVNGRVVVLIDETVASSCSLQ